MSDPDVIRAEIDATRARLSDNVDALAYQANPKNMARKKVDQVKDAGGDLVSRVMGKSEEVKQGATDRVGQAAESTSDRLSATGEAVSEKAAELGESLRRSPDMAKDMARSRTQGMPLTAGLVSFGLGAIIGSLLPASDREKEAAATLRAKTEPFKQDAADMARDIGESLREPAMAAAESVKDVAGDAAETVKNESRQAAAEVQDTAAMTKDQAREDATQVAADLRDKAQSTSAP